MLCLARALKCHSPARSTQTTLASAADATNTGTGAGRSRQNPPRARSQSCSRQLECLDSTVACLPAPSASSTRTTGVTSSNAVLSSDVVFTPEPRRVPVSGV